MSYCCEYCDGNQTDYEERLVQWQRREEKAKTLLLRFLSPEQRRTYTRYGTFRVRGSHGTPYRISTGNWVGNVEWISPSGTVLGSFCGHSDFDRVSREVLPSPDHHLAQLLSLVTDEIAWLDIAHKMEGKFPPVYQARSMR